MRWGLRQYIGEEKSYAVSLETVRIADSGGRIGYRRSQMSQLECPVCKIRIKTPGAPSNCPRCLVRNRRRVDLVPVSVFMPAHELPTNANQRAAL
jgi:hypothetical protein